jgi:hypothetical protein
MSNRFENIFWHQGVKSFVEADLSKPGIQDKVRHLENDVTKAFLNVLMHSPPAVLEAILKRISVKERQDTFSFEFQVTDTQKHTQRANRVMLSIISASTPQKSNPNYSVKQSIPDGCLYNDNTSILIEAKTQSPLIIEQIESHISHYLGTTTSRIKITWEEIIEIFRSLNLSQSEPGGLLVSHFIEFLEMLGLSDFNGFTTGDFETIGQHNQLVPEDYLDFKRLLKRKIQQFTDRVKETLEDDLDGLDLQTYVPSADKHPDAWSSLSFIKSQKDTANTYPNLNFYYFPHGMEIGMNAESKSAFTEVINAIKKHPETFDMLFSETNGMYAYLHYKFHFGVQNQFHWYMVPGFPIALSNFTSEKLFEAMEKIEDQWSDLIHTFVFEMRSGKVEHNTGRLYLQREIDFVLSRNPNPHFVLRIGNHYPQTEIIKKKDQVSYFSAEMKKLLPILSAVISS